MSSVSGSHSVRPSVVCRNAKKGWIRSVFMGIVSAWTWLEIALVALLGCAIQALLALIALPFDRNSYAAGRFFRQMGKLAAKLAPTWRFGVVGSFPKKLDPAAVVVSNHKSLADPFLISHLPWEMKWLGKMSLARLPVMGWAMRLAGDIPIQRGSAASARRAMEQCAEYLQRGMSVCIFPEGTRSKTAEMLPFKDGAFRLAIENQKDVLPLALIGTQTALPKHSWLFGKSRAMVTVGERISTRGMTLADLENLKAQARRQIESLLAKMS